MEARHHKREAFEQVELEYVENVDEAYVHGWPWDIKDYCKRSVDLQIAEQEFQLARRY